MHQSRSMHLRDSRTRRCSDRRARHFLACSAKGLDQWYASLDLGRHDGSPVHATTDHACRKHFRRGDSPSPRLVSNGQLPPGPGNDTQVGLAHQARKQPPAPTAPHHCPETVAEPQPEGPPTSTRERLGPGWDPQPASEQQRAELVGKVAAHGDAHAAGS